MKHRAITLGQLTVCSEMQIIQENSIIRGLQERTTKKNSQLLHDSFLTFLYVTHQYSHELPARLLRVQGEVMLISLITIEVQCP